MIWSSVFANCYLSKLASHRDWEMKALSPSKITFQKEGFPIWEKEIHGKTNKRPGGDLSTFQGDKEFAVTSF